MKSDFDKIKNEIQQTLVQANSLTKEKRNSKERKNTLKYLDTSIPSTGGGGYHLNFIENQLLSPDV
jgi:hypothetical protein